MSTMTGLLVAAAIGLVLLPTSWWVTDRLEEDNDFCNACHLPNGTRLIRCCVLISTSALPRI